MLLTTFFVKDSLINTNVSEVQNNLQSFNVSVAGQVATFVPNIGNEYTMRYVEDIVKQNSLVYTARMILVGVDGKVLVDSFDAMKGQRFNIAEAENALLGMKSSNIYVHKGDYIMYSAVPIMDRDVIVGAAFMSIDANYIFDEINRFMEKLFIIFMMAFLVLAVSGTIGLGISMRETQSFLRQPGQVGCHVLLAVCSHRRLLHTDVIPTQVIDHVDDDVGLFGCRCSVGEHHEEE